MPTWRGCRSNFSICSHHRYLIGIFIPLAVMACARADDAPSNSARTSVESARESVASSDERDTDAGASARPVDASGSCSGPECPECPAPTRDMMSGGQPVWSRNPETGECCRYDKLVVAPPGWPFFDTEAACQNDCRCSVLDGFIEDVGLYDTERTSLDCRCSAESCPSTIAEAEQLLCSRGVAAVQRHEGCGMVLVADRNGYSGDGWVFESPLEPSDAAAASATLVGAMQFTDVNSAPCQTYQWVAGRDFDCDSAVTCQLCGESPGEPVPPCVR